MSSGFFIRGKRKSNPKFDKNNSKKSGGRQNNIKNNKKPRFDNEEIVSSSSDEEFTKVNFKENFEEDEPITAQEKKLELAKKYLEEIEREEQKRLESAEISTDVIADRLQEKSLRQKGTWRNKIADELQVVEKTSIHTLRNKNHSLSVTCVVISSDSKFIYSASKDGSIIKWDILLKQKINSISSAHKSRGKSNTGHDGVVLCLAISHDNKFLVSGDVKHVIRIWNPETLTHIHYFKNHKGPVTGLAICRDTNTLYSSSNDRCIKVWNLEEMMYVETLFGHQSAATSVDVLCKDHAVSSGDMENSVHVWKIVEESQLIFNGTGSKIDVVKRIDDHHFITCGEDGIVSIWGDSKKKPINVINNAHDLDSITNEPNWIVSLGCMPLADVFATGSSNGCVKIWRYGQTLKESSLLFDIPLKGFINSIAFSLDNNYLVLGVGQEHKLGRWARIAEAKNSVVVIDLKKKNKAINS